MGNTGVQEKVRKLFTDYLEKNGQRKTSERLAILDKIYSLDGLFSIEQILQGMEQMKFRVSRATVYNTVTLLLDAKLIVRHNLGNGSKYEKSFDLTTHYHIICTECGKSQVFDIPAIKNIIDNTRFPRFTPNDYSLYIYGICSTCKRAKTMKLKKQNKTK